MRFARVREGWVRVEGGQGLLLDDAPWRGGRETGATAELSDLLAPVEPTKIICVGRNYRAHAEEMGAEVPAEPLLFLKPPSSLLGQGGTIEPPAVSQRVDYEGEIGVVIGRRGRNIPERQAREHIFGLTCANDVTARDIQRADVQFTRGKGFDTFCPVGPWIETDAPSLDDLELITRVDAEVRQRGRTSQMIFGIEHLVAYISAVMTLEPGDLILTGTPEGVAPLQPGQRVEVEVVGIGTLCNVMGERTVA
ncbi:MAG: fumarylacetoacetate hydrolase family protein [Sandaracinaceae bacterium]|nr:fumarylacetoacetate hydrolase family protein [Sandaracinaceae bacterium]